MQCWPETGPDRTKRAVTMGHCHPVLHWTLPSSRVPRLLPAHTETGLRAPWRQWLTPTPPSPQVLVSGAGGRAQTGCGLGCTHVCCASPCSSGDSFNWMGSDTLRALGTAPYRRGSERHGLLLTCLLESQSNLRFGAAHSGCGRVAAVFHANL